MVVVKPKPGESQDKLILRFKKRILNSGILLEIKDRERHKSQAEKRKLRKYEIRHLRDLAKKRDLAE